MERPAEHHRRALAQAGEAAVDVTHSLFQYLLRTQEAHRDRKVAVEECSTEKRIIHVFLSWGINYNLWPPFCNFFLHNPSIVHLHLSLTIDDQILFSIAALVFFVVFHSALHFWLSRG